jgi:hypothetical protein
MPALPIDTESRTASEREWPREHLLTPSGTGIAGPEDGSESPAPGAVVIRVLVAAFSLLETIR